MTTPDWGAIEREYRAGQLPIAEIGRLHGVSRFAIGRRAKSGAWTRDLEDKLRRRIWARLGGAAREDAEGDGTVEAAAARAVSVIRSHRADIARLRRIAEELARRVEAALDMAAEEEVAPVGGRDGLDAALVRLAQVTARVITLERAAFGLDEWAKAPAESEGEQDGRSDDDKRRELAALVGAALGAGAAPRA
ncbi:MAG: hypothetical protein AB7P52_11475 [Alphaproteobacteria bacterium]